MTNKYNLNSINYNENTGTYNINDYKLCNSLNLEKCNPMEKDLTINQINFLRKIIEKTTLTLNEIKLLNNYSNSFFSTTYDLSQTSNVQLKNLFPNLRGNEYLIDTLIPKAKKYLDQKNGVEGFIGNYNGEFISRLCSIICSIILLIIFIYFGIYVYNKISTDKIDIKYKF